MCRALETAAVWLSLTSIFPDRPHRWLLGKQGTVAGVSVVKRLVTKGREKEQALSHAGDGSTALGLQRSHRKMKSSTERKDRIFARTEPGFQYPAFYLRSNLNIDILEEIHKDFYCSKSNTKHPSITPSFTCFIKKLNNFFSVYRMNSPTVEAGVRNTYGDRAFREYKGQTPIISD